MTAEDLNGLTVEAIVKRFKLDPHPEGGFFRRVYVHAERENDRPKASAIYYLLDGGQENSWHRIDADEVWCWHAGHSMELCEHLDHPNTAQEAATVTQLGPDLEAGDCFQHTVRGGAWQQARTPNGWVLVSCIVVPAFTFSTFEMI